MIKKKHRPVMGAIALIITILIVIFINENKGGPAQHAQSTPLIDTIIIDGSSTVFPITEAMAKGFATIEPKVVVATSVSGTGGGFKLFCKGDTHINNASRPIKPREAETAEKYHVSYAHFKVAFDGISVVTHKDNTWLDALSVPELQRIFRKTNPAKTWNEVRPQWPNEAIHMFVPGQDSGTYDYFIEAIIGKGNEMRPDVTASEDDNVLAMGIAKKPNSIGFFGFAYYGDYTSSLRLVPITNNKGPITPSIKTIADGSYSPLSRPLYIYVNKQKMSPGVVAFLQYYFKQAETIAASVGYVPLPTKDYQDNLNALKLTH